MFIAPEIQNKLFTKDPSQINHAIMLAENDNPDNKDVRFLKSYLMRLAKVHPRMNRHILRLKTLIASPDWDIIAFDEVDKEKADNAKRRVSGIMQANIDLFIDGMLFGDSLARIEFVDTSLGKVAKIDEIFAPVEIEYNTKFIKNIALLQEGEFGKFDRIAIKANEEYLHLSYVNPDTHQVGGLLREVIYHVFMLNLSTQEWLQFQQFLKGIIQGVAQKGASPDDLVAGEAAVQTAVDSKYVFTSDKIQFAFHKIADSNAGNSFEQFSTKIEEDIEIAITGTSSLASDRQHNAMTVQERDAQDLAIWGRRNFADFINSQLLKADFRMNNSKKPNVELPYEFKFIPKMTGDKQANMNIIQSAVELGIPINLKEFQLKTGIKHAGEPDDLISLDNINSEPVGLDADK